MGAADPDRLVDRRHQPGRVAVPPAALSDRRRRMLLGGHVAQARSADNAFSTGEAYALLTEQGVKVGNPSQLVKQNVIARRVLRHQRRYRVSQIGLGHLAQLLRPLG